MPVSITCTRSRRALRILRHQCEGAGPQGFGGKIRDALTTALELEPRHAEAAIAFGAYQAEVIGKVGAIVAGLTCGAKKDAALDSFERARRRAMRWSASTSSMRPASSNDREPPIISVTNLSKTYASGFQALKNVSLEIRRGEIFALLGPNGAGKTTLIGIVCGIVNPSEGRSASTATTSCATTARRAR